MGKLAGVSPDQTDCRGLVGGNRRTQLALGLTRLGDPPVILFINNITRQLVAWLSLFTLGQNK